MKTEEIEKKKEEKLDISISNHEIGFLNFLRFIAFTILVTFIRPLSTNSLPQHKIHQLVTFMGINLSSEIDNVQK